ncbi:MAG: hypothetical protein OHK0022_49610 [Roseiflexaceae bacterium]
MKLLLVQPLSYLFSAGGAHKANRMLIEQLAARGHQCRVVVSAFERGPRAHADLIDTVAQRGAHLIASSGGMVIYQHNGVEVHEITDLNLMGAAYVFNQAQQFAPDWLLVSEDPTYVLLEAALEALPGRVVFLSHSQATLPFGPESYAVNPAKARLFQRLAGIIGCSEYVRAYLHRWAGLEAEVFRFPVYGDGPFPFLARFDQGAITMINPALIKGITITLELARLLPALPFAAVPTWATSPDDRAALAALPNMQILDPFEQIDELFARTRVLLVPSLWGESFGQIVVEAMLRGIPVLASRVGGLPEAKLGVDYLLPVNPIERYRESISEQSMRVVPVIPDQDAGPWRAALERLCSDREHYEQIAHESQRAALAFARGLGVAPFERYLERLAGPTAPATTAATAPQRSLEQLSPERRALLALRLGQKAAAQARQQQIPAVARTQPGQRFPLSFAQRRLWFLEQLNPGSASYNAGAAFRLHGRLDEEALRRSLAAIVQRHDILRTVFPSEDGQPFQQVLPGSELAWSVVDLRNLPAGERAEAAKRYAVAESRQIFELANGPVFRATLLHIADGEYGLVLAMHHIVVDGWSVGVIVRELSLFYNAYSAGRTLALPELPLQYADYAVWQDRWLASPDLQRQLDYWKGQLAAAPAMLDLPVANRRDPSQGFSGGRYWLRLDTALTQGLQHLVEAEGATMFMGLLLLFAATLHRACAQDDIMVGTLIANRRQAELQGLIGFFVNTLVLRVRLAERPTFRELLRQVREATLAAYDHQDVPFETVIEALQPERNLHATPLAQVLFNLHDAGGDELRLNGLSTHYLDYEKGLAGMDLALDLWSREDGIEGVFEFNTLLFDFSTIDHLARAFQELLAAMVATPDTPVAFAPLLKPEQAQRMLAEGVPATTPAGLQPVDLLVAERAATNPAAPAVSYAGETLSYSELERRANRLAHALRSSGVGAGDTVVLMLETGPQQVIALLGVLKAGAAFSVLEPGLPDQRAEAILAQQMPRTLVACPAQAARLADLAQRALGAVPPLLPPDGPELDGQPEHAPAPTARLESPVYIVATSGSTGTPKGIVQSHGSFCQFTNWFAQEFRLGPGRRVAQWATLSYDAAYCEIFATLCAGATLCLADPATRYEPLALLRWLGDEAVDLFQTVPSFAAQLLGLIESDPALAAGLGQLEQLLLAGEMLPVELAEAWRRQLPKQTQLYNLYGPTEAILATYHELPAVQPSQRIIPVGRAIPGRQILVLDQAGQLCPPGVIGEIVIRSRFLTLGYQGQPALTAEKFRADPFDPGSDLRLYHTGDQGRWLPDGTLEFCGRADQQVKIRGMRVELAEIEVALVRHPAVRAAAVVLRDEPDAARLVAYVVPAHKPGSAEDTNDPQGSGSNTSEAKHTAFANQQAQLRAYLASQLPEHMLPTAFVLLDALPLTRNGKLDRRALPDLQATDLVQSAAFVAPRTPTEQALAGLWGALLNLDQPGVHDNFFAAGGHSLLATRLLARIRQHFQVELSLLSLFEGPTIAELATQIDQAQSARAETRVARALARLNQLSDEEVRQLLQQKRQTRREPEDRPMVEPR